MAEVKSWILNIAAVAVLVIVLDLLMPEGKVRNFTQLVAGFVIMFAMINPVFKLIDKDIPASFAGWRDEVYLLNKRFEYSNHSLKEEQSRQVLELYRSMLVSDIKNRLENSNRIKEAEVDAVLNENTSSEKFGEIRKLYINLLIDGSAGAGGQNPEQLREAIRNELKQALSIDEDKIVINVSEKD
ncbi:MAG: stage III sporulation protein AF [Clostridiaceae bacterium]|jgi:stage III sporulation protein AF|nr:stage III sporulation protein AF [Clostridiaceae bacterium]